MAEAPRSTTEERASSRRLGALGALWPFLRPYRGLIAAAVAALVLTAAVSLALPVAVRRVVDHFGEAELALLDRYFGGAIAMAGLLAGERRCATTS
jgi:ATP-binding cassette subfamily B protein